MTYLMFQRVEDFVSDVIQRHPPGPQLNHERILPVVYQAATIVPQNETVTELGIRLFHRHEDTILICHLAFYSVNTDPNENTSIEGDIKAARQKVEGYRDELIAWLSRWFDVRGGIYHVEPQQLARATWDRFVNGPPMVEVG